MPRKRTDPLDQRLSLFCPACEGSIEVAIRDIIGKGSDFRPPCPTCGKPFDRKKSAAALRKLGEEALAPLRKVLADLKLKRDKLERKK
jgi:hypothetical protein